MKRSQSEKSRVLRVQEHAMQARKSIDSLGRSSMNHFKGLKKFEHLKTNAPVCRVILEA